MTKENDSGPKGKAYDPYDWPFDSEEDDVSGLELLRRYSPGDGDHPLEEFQAMNVKQLWDSLDAFMARLGDPHIGMNRAWVVEFVVLISAELGSRLGIAEFRTKFAPQRGRTAPIAGTEGDRLIAMHKRGMSYKEISDESTRGRNSIGNYVRKHCDCPKCEHKRTKHV